MKLSLKLWKAAAEWRLRACAKVRVFETLTRHFPHMTSHSYSFCLQVVVLIKNTSATPEIGLGWGEGHFWDQTRVSLAIHMEMPFTCTTFPNVPHLFLHPSQLLKEEKLTCEHLNWLKEGQTGSYLQELNMSRHSLTCTISQSKFKHLFLSHFKRFIMKLWKKTY